MELRNEAKVLQEVLFCGRDAEDRGLLLRFSVRAPRADGWQLEEECALADRDLVGIAHARSSRQLYALDATNGVILRASWSPGTPLPAAASWTEVAQFGALEEGAQLELRRLAIASKGPPVVLVSSLVSTDDCIATEEERRVFEIEDDGRSVSLRLVVRPQAEATPKIAADRLELSCSELPVRGAAGTVVEIVRMDAGSSSLPIARIRLDENGRGTARLAEPGALVFGGIFAARAAGSARSHGPFLAAARSWRGGPGLGGAREMLWGGSLAALAWPGSRGFAVEVELRPRDAARESRLRARLLIGRENDPIRRCGTSQLLGAPQALATASRRAALPLPAEPLLGGLELRLEWLVEDGEELALSSIRGIALRRQAWLPPEAPAFLGSMASSAPPLEPASTSEEAWEHWMRALRAAPVPPAELAAIEQRLGGR
ncbi:MAG: hypothetical protein IPN34_08365 [Planctomycetes bacterium]|nr:hypothetical protein [Planctomycetota bacterium]